MQQMEIFLFWKQKKTEQEQKLKNKKSGMFDESKI